MCHDSWSVIVWLYFWKTIWFSSHFVQLISIERRTLDLTEKKYHQVVETYQCSVLRILMAWLLNDSSFVQTSWTILAARSYILRSTNKRAKNLNVSLSEDLPYSLSFLSSQSSPCFIRRSSSSSSSSSCQNSSILRNTSSFFPPFSTFPQASIRTRTTRTDIPKAILLYHQLPLHVDPPTTLER